MLKRIGSKPNDRVGPIVRKAPSGGNQRVEHAKSNKWTKLRSDRKNTHID